MIRKTALAATMAALLTPAVAGALGLGNIEVGSALNEPLDARIPLRGAAPGEFEELRVLLADEQQFQRAGLDRVFILSRLRFEVVETGNGNGFIRVSTREPVAEPFLNFLVDVNWPRGRVLREYTVLLDPPVYGAAIASGSTRSVRTVQSLPEPSTAPAPAPPPRAARPAAAPPAGSPSAPPRWTGDRYGPVRAGETLWSIADRVRAQGVSIQSTMLALLRANPEAFSIDNVNALRTGAVLRIPPASEIAGGKAAALAEVARQHALWEEYRQSSAAAVGAQPGAAPPVATAPVATAPPTPAGGAAPAAAAGAGTPASELKLVGAGTAGAATGGGVDVAALRNELTMAQEESEAAKRENEELQSRLSEVETLVDDLKRLVELKEDQLAALQDQLARASEAPATPVTPPPADTGPAGEPAESTAAETVAAAPEKPVESAPAKPVERTPPPPPPPPKSMLDEAADLLPVPLWTVPAALGALLVALGGMRFARRRKARAEEAGAAGMTGAAGAAALADDEPDFDAFAPTQMPVADAAEDAVTELPSKPAPDDGTLFDDEEAERTDPSATARTTGPGGADEEDPLAEVNVYLAYERFDQAEQLVRDAIGNHPDRPDYRLKLLEVFYAAKNVAGFEAAAGELQDAVGADHAMMQQAREWWGDLGAGHELFADAGPSTEQRPSSDGDDMFDVTASETGEETGVDFDLGFETDDTRAGASGLDFDLGESDEAGSDSASDSSLDFDLGSLGEAAAGGVPGAGTGLDFDLGAGDDDVPTRRAGDDADSAETQGAGTGLDFDLDAGDTPARPGADSGAASGTGLDFDLDAGTPADAGDRDRASPGTQTADDGETGLDFDLGGFGDDEDTRKTDAAADDSALDFDLGDTGTGGPASATGSGETRDDAGGADDSELDFDLADTLEAPQRAAAPDAGAGTGADSMADSALDFDLGDTFEAPRGGAAGAADEGAGSALDFDLGDTHETPRDDDGEDEKAAGADSALDFDLGDTHETPRDEDGEDEKAAGADSALDFDLGDTQTMGDARADASDSSSEDSVLDFDLGDTGGDTRVASGESQELDFDIGTPGGDDEDEPLSLDMNLEDTGAGDAARDGAGSPDLTLDMDEPEPPPASRGSSIDTVKLSPGDVSGLRGQAAEEEAGTGSGFGVDTEFRDIFGGGGASDDGPTGQASELDFDLGSADFGTGTDAGGDDLESTQFSLRDDQPEGGDDDEDHTLVLGRGASGEVDEMQTKLDLAQAYMDMGDSEGARNLLGEVMAEGDDAQKGQAREMLQNLS